MTTRDKHRYPAVHCTVCKVRTTSKTGLCKDCRPPRPAPTTEAKCGICGSRTRRKSRICKTCSLSPGGDPTAVDRLLGGRFVAVGGIQRFVPWTDEDCAERTRRALADMHRRRVQSLLAERYGSSSWWKAPDVIPAGPQIAAERLDALAADFERADARTRPESEVA